MGVRSGGGSAQVDAPCGAPGGSVWGKAVYFPSSPLKFIRAKAPNAKVQFDEGSDPAAAASLAKDAQVAIVFVNQWMSEGSDAKTLSLPDNQDALVEAVAAANPHTIVVLETGGPVSMPWADKVAGILEAWYPGIGGGEAIANLLFGDVNPSAKLPATFAKSEADLPHPQIPGIELAEAAMRAHQWKLPPFEVNYTEGLKVGYKWFEAEKKEPLFPFGFGLSYTTYAYSDLKADASSVSFAVKNTGSRAGTEIAEVYAKLPASAGEPFKRLVGFKRVTLAAGESKTVTIAVDPLYLSIFNVEKNAAELVPGDYTVLAGGSERHAPEPIFQVNK
jgi:beta-glucosidase